MKYLLLILAFTVSLSAKAQAGFEFNLGMPTGESSEFIGIGIDLKVNFLIPVTKEFKVGPSLSLIMNVGKDYETEDGDDVYGEIYPYIVPSAKAEYIFSERYVTSLHLGYAFHIGFEEDSIGNGIYYKPSFGYLLTQSSIIQVFYANQYVDEGSLSYFGIGFVYYSL